MKADWSGHSAGDSMAHGIATDRLCYAFALKMRIHPTQGRAQPMADQRMRQRQCLGDLAMRKTSAKMQRDQLPVEHGQSQECAADGRQQVFLRNWSIASVAGKTLR